VCLLDSAYDKAVREQRILAEIAQAKRENRFYMENVDKAKLIENIQKHKDRKRSSRIHNESLDEGRDGDFSDTFEKIKQKFRQRKPIDDDEDLAMSSFSSAPI
jgi:ESF2/ABP1 family protein